MAVAWKKIFLIFPVFHFSGFFLKTFITIPRYSLLCQQSGVTW